MSDGYSSPDFGQNICPSIFRRYAEFRQRFGTVSDRIYQIFSWSNTLGQSPVPSDGACLGLNLINIPECELVGAQASTKSFVNFYQKNAPKSYETTRSQSVCGPPLAGLAQSFPDAQPRA
jgi:hypothetical protein